MVSGHLLHAYLGRPVVGAEPATRHRPTATCAAAQQARLHGGPGDWIKDQVTGHNRLNSAFVCADKRHYVK